MPGAGLTSQRPVIAITALPWAIWHKYDMANVGTKSNILRVSSKLKKSLVTAGAVEHYPFQASVV